MNEKMIFADDPEAAIPVTVTAYKSLDGSIWLNEKMARYRSSTHVRCGVESHPPYRSNSYCHSCHEERIAAKYAGMPPQPFEWDGGSGWFMEFATDNFFSSQEEVIEHCVEHEIDPKNLQLVHCEANRVEVEECAHEQFCDFIPDGGDLPVSVVDAWVELVEKLKKCPPVSYGPINVAVELPEDFSDLYEQALVDTDWGDA